jgi:hypothetical protein
MSRLHTENHLVSRIGWLRAAVLEGPCNNQRQDKEKQEFTTYRRASQGLERTAKIFACDVAKIGKTSLALMGQTVSKARSGFRALSLHGIFCHGTFIRNRPLANAASA